MGSSGFTGFCDVTASNLEGGCPEDLLWHLPCLPGHEKRWHRLNPSESTKWLFRDRVIAGDDCRCYTSERLGRGSGATEIRNGSRRSWLTISGRPTMTPGRSRPQRIPTWLTL